MTTHDDTPAPSRRFLPASASSTAKSFGPPSIYRTPFQAPRSTQLLSSAPPSTSTPRFQRPPGTWIKDDIDVSFDDDDVTPAPPQSYSTSKGHNVAEAIDDYPQEQSPLLHRTTHIGRKWPEDSVPRTEHGILGSQHEIHPSTPATKKRKAFHIQNKKREPIIISSSPEYEEEDLIPYPAPDSPAARYLSEDELDEEFQTPDPREVTTTSRFKETTSGPKTITSVTRGAFRSLPRNENVPQVSGGSALPDVFSPSKRNGKHDYTATGNAELVRQWVLNIAAQQSQVAQQQHEIVVAEVKPDNSCRFVVVLDTDGSEWLVPGQYQESRTSLPSGLNDIRPGTRLALMSEAARWAVPVGTSTSKRDIAVAAYWEVLL